MPRSLIIGYGNIDRADDGVAYEAINTLRRRQGREPLGEENTGLEELGEEVDSIFLSQLTPELMELLCDYDRVVFVDAHVNEDNGIKNLHCVDVLPEYTPASLTHHLTPGMLLALIKAVYQRELIGHLVSIRGYDFGFHRNLSAGTRALMGQAVGDILQWLNGDVHP
jgi:hydrogenase maturation protease